MHFSSDRVAQFATWSADRNPLHVDARFARQTHFGRPIVHGVLTVLETLREAAPNVGQITAIDLEFRSAAIVGPDYETRRQDGDQELVVTAHADGQLLLSVRAALGQLHSSTTSDLGWVGSVTPGEPRDVPVERSLAEFDRGVVVTGAYPLRVEPDPAAVQAGLRHEHARVLALCSYITGMELPGMKSLFMRISVQFHGVAGDAPELRYRARTTRFDRQFRLLDTELEVATPAGVLIATALLRSYVPFSPAQPNVSEIAARVDASSLALEGKVALVIGGSRGLGAEIAASLALARCRVYASSRQDDGAQETWAREVSDAGGALEFICGDAGDPGWCESTLAMIRERHGRLDVLVLNACAPPGVLRLGAGSAVQSSNYIRENLQLVETPLATFADALEQSAGSLVCISSSFVEDPPPGFGHYVAVKQASEGLVRTICRERSAVAGLIVRPPTLQTRWNDTPAGIVGAMPSQRAAIHTVNALARGIEPGHVAALSEFPSLPTLEAENDASEGPINFSIRAAATFTLDPLLAPLRFWANELDLHARVEAAPYGQVLQSLLDPTSVLNAKTRGVNVVMLRVRDWLRELADTQAGDIEFVRRYLQDTVRDFARALQGHRAQATSETVLLVCPSYGALSAAESILLRQAETDLVEATNGVPGLEVVFAGDYHRLYGVNEDDVHDELRDDLAHIPYRDDYLAVLATLVARHVHRRATPQRKVVVVDCDNTLWRGVVGEVGAEGVEFDDGHHALHKTLTRLAQSGVLVCLCSKNEEADVWRVFETRRDLLLDRQHVVAATVNWLPKSQNLRTLATRLNLGLDSFMFIDDNPVECAEVQAACPEVLTLQWPTDAGQAERVLQHAWEFDARRGTREDELRTELYKQEFRRQEARAETLTFEDFINNLQLVVDFAPLAADDVRRAAQLTLRTNQFNFTTIRRDEAEMQALASGGRHQIRTVRVRDRFGDYGLVGLVVVEQDRDTWTVDTFLLSCRVLGRGVEHRIVAELGRMATEAGVGSVKLQVETTKRNTPARSFLDAIIPAAFKKASDRVLQCDVPVDVLASIRFEPTTAGEVVVQDDSGRTASVQPVDTNEVRRRERQITRAAFELATGVELRAAMDGGRVTPAADEGRTPDDVTAVVLEAFARALRLTPERVAEVDDLEPLGCDSLRIVDITVALSESFPSLPSTLLFEHRSVSRIITEISRLLQRAETPATSTSARTSTLPRASSGDAHRTTDIAVVGLNVRCAEVNSPEELWALLSGGRSAVKPVAVDRPHFLHPLSDTRPHWAGLLERPAQFDPEFFGVSPREAEFMDPQLRLFLEVAWGALEDAGCAGADHDPSTGVFAGVMYGDYGFRANVGSAANAYRCWEGFSLANRLSQLLGFHGPSLAVDTACSSSGTAVHLACAALNAGECNVAVVGGVNLILDADRFASLGRLGILSMRGRCEPFGADADGTVLGEGGGVVVLRPLDEAIRRRDRIYGVIKGTGLSTGSGTVGFTAPNPQAQAAAIRRALQSARVDPRTVSYIETHGTGTALGDPIEVRGLMLGYGSLDLRDPALELTHHATIGSIKPNVGHLEAGAGVIGLIKVLLQLHRGKLLPSSTSAQPNSQIPFADGPFDVQRTLTDWPRPMMEVHGAKVAVPRRAGLSSFGVGGANAHVIIEEAPPAVPVKVSTDRPLHALALSARTEASLQQQAQALRDYFEGDLPAAVSDVCFTVNTGRKHLGHRLMLTGSNREDMLHALRQAAEGGEPRASVRGAVTAATKQKIAFLFTGQGSQYAGMGQQLYESQPVFRHALDRCAAIFDTLLKRPLLDLLFAPAGSADAELLNQTGYTQPALFAFEYALSELWQSWGIRPDIVLGHSVGEIGAMCVAGGVSLEDGLKLIAARGRLMQALPAGGVMTSVMADETRVLQAIAGAEDVVAIAAINAPGQVVISGAGTAVAEIEARLSAEGIKTKALTVSHAFHSPLMRPMLAEYEQVVRQIKFSTPRVPFVNAVDGVLSGDEVTRTEYWLRNVIEPVRFAAGVSTLEAEHVTTYLEVGPHPVLVGMARQSIADEGAAVFLPSLRKDTDAWQTMLGSLGALYARGSDIHWKGFDEPYERKRASVPSYRFTKKDYWLRSVPALSDTPRAHAESTPSHVEEAGPRFYEVAWRKASPVAGAPGAQRNRHWLVIPDYGGVGAALVTQLTAGGAAATLLTGDDVDFARVWSDVCERDPSAIPGVIFLPALDALSASALNASRLQEELDRIVLGAVRVMQGATAALPQSKVWIATRNAIAPQTVASQPVALSASPLWGLGRTFALEHPDHFGGMIDLALDGDAIVRALTAELMSDGAEDQVAVTEAGRHVARLAPMTLAPTVPVALDAAGTYIVTGGVGALGLHVARWLVANGARHLALVSRRAQVSREAQATIDVLKGEGASIAIVSADVSRPSDVDRLIGEVPAAFPLRGIVHAAGIDTTVPIASMTRANLLAAHAGKAIGAWLLHERTRGVNLDLFICFSSMSSVLGAQHRGHYAAANAFLDALVLERRRLGLRATAVNWGPWTGGGIATAADIAHFERIGNHGLRPDDAMRALSVVMGSGVSQTLVADVNWETFRAAFEGRRARRLLAELGGASRAAQEPTSPAAAPWIERLRSLPPAERAPQLATLLSHEVADTLGFDTGSGVALDANFYDLGMDSLMMADLVGRLKARVGVSCTGLVFDHPNVRSLSERMLDRLPIDNSESQPAETTASQVAPEPRVSTGPIRYDPTTEADLLEFQAVAFPERRGDWVAPRWRWMFVESAARLGVAPRFWAHRQDGAIVGQMGSIPVRLKVGEDVLETGWLVETMVLPEFRSQAVGSRLMVDAHEDQPFSLSLGQTEEMRTIQLRLGWKSIAPLQVAQFMVRPGNVLRGKVPTPAAWAADLGWRASSALRDLFGERATYKAKSIDRFDATHDALWATASRDLQCAVVRDSSYLNWKYVTQPGQAFLRLEVYDDSGLKGVSVWAFREPDANYRYRRAFLIDLVAPLSNDVALQQILKASCSAVAEHGVDALLCHHLDKRLTQALRACGFHLRRPGRILLVDPGQLPQPVADSLLSADSWFVTQGDSDIDRPW